MSFVIGQYYPVPCIEEREDGDLIGITPVIDHPHNDVENGQDYTHYHGDFRFISGKGVILKNGNVYRSQARVQGTPIIYMLKCIRLEHEWVTNIVNISNSKLKHKCIHKGKCPHRGYDLTGEIPKNGVITCPLHGLKFNAETKILLNETMEVAERTTE